MSNIECRRMESLAQRRRLRRVLLSLFNKMDRSTQSLDPEALEGKLTTGRIHSFDTRMNITKKCVIVKDIKYLARSPDRKMPHR